MRIGFTTFCTENYKEILGCLIESVIEFSKYEITVFSINFDYVHPNDRVKSKRIDLINTDYYNVCKTKIISCLQSEYDVGLILDTDMIVTKEIDNIFDENVDRILDSKFPLFAKHPHNPFTHPYTKSTVKEFTEHEPKMKYVYASFLFSKNNLWFLEEVLDEMNKRHIMGEDEIIINSLLTKYQVDYDIGYNYLPNGTENLLNDYLNDTVSEELRITYLSYDCPVKFYIFHGHNCKNPEIMRSWINLIKNKK